jgi:hypothetical protein
MKPPTMIDNARVLWWAWAGDEPFGFCGDIAFHGFAICRYDSGPLYRFSCDRNWQTVQDRDYEDEEEAKRRISENYLSSVHRVVWHGKEDQ